MHNNIIEKASDNTPHSSTTPTAPLRKTLERASSDNSSFGHFAMGTPTPPQMFYPKTKTHLTNLRESSENNKSTPFLKQYKQSSKASLHSSASLHSHASMHSIDSQKSISFSETDQVTEFERLPEDTSSITDASKKSTQKKNFMACFLECINELIQAYYEERHPVDGALPLEKKDL